MAYVQNFPGGFQSSVRAPLDYRGVVDDIANLEPVLEQTAYVGLIIYDKATQKHYKITAEAPALAYEEFTGGSGESLPDIVEARKPNYNDDENSPSHTISIGTRWLDSSTGFIWLCTSAADANAIWKKYVTEDELPGLDSIGQFSLTALNQTYTVLTAGPYEINVNISGMSLDLGSLTVLRNGSVINTLNTTNSKNITNSFVVELQVDDVISLSTASGEQWVTSTLPSNGAAACILMNKNGTIVTRENTKTDLWRYANGTWVLFGSNGKPAFETGYPATVLDDEDRVFLIEKGKVYSYRDDEGWQTRATVNVGVNSLNAFHLDGIIYVAFDDEKIYKYNIANDTWTFHSTATTPASIVGHLVATRSGKMWLWGGSSSSAYYNGSSWSNVSGDIPTLASDGDEIVYYASNKIFKYNGSAWVDYKSTPGNFSKLTSYSRGGVIDPDGRFGFFSTNLKEIYFVEKTTFSDVSVNATLVPRGRYVPADISGWGIVADRDPGVNDSSQSTEFLIRINQIWLNQTTGEAFICLDDRPGFVKWSKYLTENDLPVFVNNATGRIRIPASYYGSIDNSQSYTVPSSGEYDIRIRGTMTLDKDYIVHYVKANGAVIDKNVFNLDPKMPSGFYSSNTLSLTAGDVITQSFEIDAFPTRKWSILAVDDTPVSVAYFPSMTFIDDGLWCVAGTRDKVWMKDLRSGDWIDKSELQGPVTEPRLIENNGTDTIYLYGDGRIYERAPADSAWRVQTGTPDWTGITFKFMGRNSTHMFLADSNLQNVWDFNFLTKTWENFFPGGSPLPNVLYQDTVVTKDSAYMSEWGQIKLSRYFPDTGVTEDLATYADYPVFTAPPTLQVNVVNDSVYVIDKKEIYVIDTEAKRFYHVTADLPSPINIDFTTFNHDGLIVTGEAKPDVYEFNIFSIEEISVFIEKKSRGVYYPLAAGLAEHIGESGMLYGPDDPTPVLDSSNPGVFQGVFYTNDVTGDIFVCRDDAIGVAVWDKVITNKELDAWNGNSILSSRPPTSADNLSSNLSAIRQFAFWYDSTNKEAYVCMSVSNSSADWRKLVTVSAADKQTIDFGTYNPGTETPTPKSITAIQNALYSIELVEVGYYKGSVTYDLKVNDTVVDSVTFTGTGATVTRGQSFEQVLAAGDAVTIEATTAINDDSVGFPNETSSGPINMYTVREYGNAFYGLFPNMDIPQLEFYSKSNIGSDWTLAGTVADIPKSVDFDGYAGLLYSDRVELFYNGGKIDFTGNLSSVTTISTLEKVIFSNGIYVYRETTKEIYFGPNQNYIALTVPTEITDFTIIRGIDSGIIIYDGTLNRMWRYYAQNNSWLEISDVLTGMTNVGTVDARGTIITAFDKDSRIIRTFDQSDDTTTEIVLPDTIVPTGVMEIGIMTNNRFLIADIANSINYILNPSHVSGLSLQVTSATNSIEIPSLGSTSRKFDFVTATELNFNNSGLNKVLKVNSTIDISSLNVEPGLAWLIRNTGVSDMAYTGDVQPNGTPITWSPGHTHTIIIDDEGKFIVY